MQINYALKGKPFEYHNEMTDSFSDLLDLHIYYLYKYHSWVGPENNLQNMMGIVVSRDEFEANLMKATDSIAFSRLADDEKSELISARECFNSRVEATKKEGKCPLFIKITDAFNLDSFELCVVMMLLCCELNRKYEKLFAYIQDDITKKYPMIETAVRLFADPDEQIAVCYTYFTQESPIMKFLCEGSENGMASRPLRLKRRIIDFLVRAETSTDTDFYTADSQLHKLYIDEDILRCIMNAVLFAQSKVSLVYLMGSKGSGRKFIIKHCACQLHENILFVSADTLCSAENIAEAFNDEVCRSRLHDCTVCVTDFDIFLSEENKQKLSAFTAAVNSSRMYLGTHLFITAETKWQQVALCEDIVKIDFEIPETDEKRRLVLWNEFLKNRNVSEEIDTREMASKFRFTAGQVSAAAERASDLTRIAAKEIITPEVLHQSCYDQVVVGLNTLAALIKPAYSWEDLVLPKSEVDLLKEACTHIKYRHTVYNVWGFSRKAAYGRGLSMLFSGPPGTGKTMAAQVITNQLHMQMYKVQLSQIVSKYIGETEKNLRKVFDEAKTANCILFFDETDALFGKRSEVKDSHDRNANIETAYLLQQMEEYDGVVLMATNLLQNIDEAFMRRINFVISFRFPDVPTRRLLWKKMLDTDVPLSEDVDYDFLAENFKLAGGNIKNCAIHAAFLAAAEDSPICMRHLVKSVVNEQRKNNVVVLREDLKEYADIAFGEN